MTTGLYKYVRKRQVCQQGARSHKQPNRFVETRVPDELWIIALIDPAERDNNKGYMVMIIDHFTKWIDTEIINQKNEQNLYENAQKGNSIKQDFHKTYCSRTWKEFTIMDLNIIAKWKRL